MKIFIGVLLLAATSVSAQWGIVADKLLGKYITDYGGCISYKDGIVWAGYSSLWFSRDSGINWINTSFSGTPIMDIQFYNRDTGVIAVMDQGIYLTTNGGKSFSPVASIPVCLSACFGDNSRTIICANRYPNGGFIHISSDLGKTWKKIQVEDEVGSVYQVQYHPISKSIIALSRGVTPRRRSRLHISTDNGVSWTRQTGEVDLDCYGFTFHPCKRDIVYVINEDHNEHPNGLSEIFTSYDMGGSFFQTFSRSSSSLAGVATATDRSVFVASTNMPNILRSIDSGWTWHNIGGPELKEDSRSLCAISDDIILAADREGNIWRTMNAGGFPLGSSPSPEKKYQLQTEKGINQTNRTVPAVIPLYLNRSKPLPPMEFSIFYDKFDYTHDGTYNLKGVRVDVPTQSVDGKIKVRFTADDLLPNGDSLIGFSKFYINAYELFCDYIYFDSAFFDAYTGICDTLPLIKGTKLTVGNYSGCGGVTASVNDAQLDKQFVILPNPARGKITIRTDRLSERSSVKVYDVTGRLVSEQIVSFFPYEQYEVDLSMLPSAVYYIRLVSVDRSETYPLIITK